MKIQYTILLGLLYVFASCEDYTDSKLKNPTANSTENVNTDNLFDRTLNKEYFSELKADTTKSRDNIKIVMYHYFLRGQNSQKNTVLNELLSNYNVSGREFVLTKTDSIELSNYNIEMKLSDNQRYLFYYRDTLFLDVMRPFTGLNERHDTIIKGHIEKYNSKGRLVLFN